MILDCEDGYYLADPEIMDAYVNGNRALVTETEWNGTAVTVEYFLAVSSGLHGQVVSFHDGSDVTFSLFAEGSAEPGYTVRVLGGTKDSSGKYTAVYDIPSVTAGTYTVQMSKKSRVTREHTVTVGGDVKTLNAEIWLFGDVTGDGIRDMTDAVQIRRKFNGKTSVFSKGDAGTKAYRPCFTDRMTLWYYPG